MSDPTLFQDREAEPAAESARRETRRALFTAALGITAGASALALASRADAQTLTDADLLNFALNLKYLEANFYAFVTTGTAIGSGYTGGVTTAGAAGAATGGRKVTFTDPLVSKFAFEIATEKLAHVAIIRSALGASVVAQPAIDLGAGATNAFSAFARAAGLIGDGATFDPYASDENVLLSAFMFEDVTVTALKGLTPLVSNLTYVDLLAALIGASGYHASMIRTSLFRKGQTDQGLIDATEKLSAARDRYDGGDDLDQGVATVSTSAGAASNIVPADGDGVVYSRSAAQTLNILYLTNAAVASGGFFPAGVNGAIKTSAAN